MSQAGTVLTSGSGPGASTPAFSVSLSSTQSNVTGDGTVYTIPWNTIAYDQASNFNASTGVFTAPTTGIYLLTARIYTTGQDTSNSGNNVSFVVSGSPIRSVIISDYDVSQSSTSNAISTMVKLTVSTQVTVSIQSNNSGSKNVSVYGGYTIYTNWEGIFLA